MKKTVCIAVALAGAMALTGCTNSTPEESRPTAAITTAPAPTKSPSATPEPTMSILPISPEEEAAQQTAAEKTAIATVYQKFFDSTEALTQTDVDEVNAALYSQGIIEPSANQWKEGYKNVVPEIMTVDSSGSTEEQRIQFYLDLMTTPAFQEGSGASTVLVPGDAITVNGDSATIDVNQLNLSVDGQLSGWSNRIREDAKVNLVKKDGSWLLKLDDGLMWNSSSYDEATGNNGGHD